MGRYTNKALQTINRGLRNQYTTPWLDTDHAEEHQNQLLRANHGSLVYDILSEEASENICFCCVRNSNIAAIRMDLPMVPTEIKLWK